MVQVSDLDLAEATSLLSTIACSGISYVMVLMVQRKESIGTMFAAALAMVAFTLVPLWWISKRALDRQEALCRLCLSPAMVKAQES